MAVFRSYRVEEDQTGCTLILFMDPSYTEFAAELGSGNNGSVPSLSEQIQDYINQNLPNLKVSAVKLMVGSLLIATLPVGVFAETGTTATSSPTAVQQAAYTNYTIAAGDSLWTISQKFKVSIDSIKTLNGLTSDMLSIGKILKIPTPAPAPAPTPAPTTTTYKAVAGDSLWSISQKFGVTVTGIKTLNNLTSDMLYIGQVLKIPSVPAPTPAPAPTPTPTPAPSTTPYINYTSHTVVSGENAWTISLKYGIPMTELLRVNNLTMDSMLNIGQVLKIPVHVVPVMQTPGPQYGEYMDWWTGAQYVFPIGKVAKVTDFKTGRSFMVKRTIGANHSDTEPLTSADSAIIKEVWGGAYSWTPRAVIVEVDGRRIAASMASMPHSIEYIADNNFDGHFDIHFLNSTRHKDGLIDPGHQAQIKIAAGVTQI